MTRQNRRPRGPRPHWRVARLENGELCMVPPDARPDDPWVVRGRVRTITKILPGTTHESGRTPCLQDELPLDLEMSGNKPVQRKEPS